MMWIGGLTNRDYLTFNVNVQSSFATQLGDQPVSICVVEYFLEYAIFQEKYFVPVFTHMAIVIIYEPKTRSVVASIV